ncbi:MAG: TrkA C-terminal domain-containing protein [Desulfobacterales bacterium]|nr:TrkA C-terminal domain-containing protein [Desulfobacterales bacterium]
MIAILSLFVVAMLSLVVTRIATMALMLTGLSSETARFQARSAYTGVGFTTSETELIVNHPVRRRIIMLLMLLGNIGIATVVATLIISLINTSASEKWLWDVTMLILGLSLLLWISKNKWVERRLNKLIAWGLQRWTKLEVQDYIALLQLQNGYTVSEMKVSPSDWLSGKILQEAALPLEGILVLGIQRMDGTYIGTPQAETQIVQGDTLVLYGQMKSIQKIDQRQKGDDGDTARRQAVDEHKSRIKSLYSNEE